MFGDDEDDGVWGLRCGRRWRGEAETRRSRREEYMSVLVIR